MSEISFSNEDFGALLEESLSDFNIEEGSVVKGTIVGLEKDTAVIDVGLKVEGRVPIREFGSNLQEINLAIGDTVEVFLDRVENAMGEAVLSRDKARREESWLKLEKAFESNEKVNGLIYGQVKGGFTVDIDGVGAFLPRSQVDIRPIHDVNPLMNTPQPFHILKMDKRRGNIVVSRRMVLEETRAVQRSELVQSLEEGQVVEGVVKNITEYGAFVDLGGLDGLLHVTDIAWRRINHPGEVLKISDIIKCQVIRINQDTQRISLGIKQLEADPWLDIEKRYTLSDKFKGRITNIADYGAFVELEEGIEGLIHVSEMSWTKKNVHPSKIVSTSQEVEVVVLEIDPSKRRISLGLKQTLRNPWEAFSESHAEGSEVEGAIKNKTEFGLFIGLEDGIDGMVHMSDLDWNLSGEEALETYKKGQVVKAMVLDVDVEKERVSLGIKQLIDDPIASIGKRGSVVTCEVVEIKESGLEVKIVDTEVTAFLRRSELSRDRDDQRTDRFSIGDKFDARITLVDKKTRKVQVSVKALEVAEEKEAIAQYGSTDAGASLGDILGAALKAGDGSEDSGKGSGSKSSTAKKKKASKGKAESEKSAKDDQKKKAKKSSKTEKAEKTKGSAESETADKSDQAEEAGKSSKSAKSKKTEKPVESKSDDSDESKNEVTGAADKPDQTEKAGKSAKSDETGEPAKSKSDDSDESKSEVTGAADKPDQTEKSVKSAKSDETGEPAESKSDDSDESKSKEPSSEAEDKK